MFARYITPRLQYKFSSSSSLVSRRLSFFPPFHPALFPFPARGWQFCEGTLFPLGLLRHKAALELHALRPRALYTSIRTVGITTVALLPVAFSSILQATFTRFCYLLYLSAPC